MALLTNIMLAFIPVFVAVDAIGVLPILASLTEGLDDKQKNQIIVQSTLTAVCLADGSVCGHLVLHWMIS